MMFRKAHGAAITGFLITIIAYGSIGLNNGCIDTGGAYIICPDAYTPSLPDCFPEAGAAQPQAMPCEGECLAVAPNATTTSQACP
jgi:hypothetical protein